LPDKKYLKIGVFLLITSFIIGYDGLSVFMILYLWTDHSLMAWIGSGIYTFSWCILGVGFILSGKEGMEIIKTKYYKHQSNG